MRFMKLRAFVFFPAVALLAVAAASPVPAQDSSVPKAFDPAQEEALRQLIHDYIMENPEVLLEAVKVYRERQQAVEDEEARQELLARSEELTRDPATPVIGNPDGDVVIVEFFDYRCPYCIRVAESLREAVRDDGNIRLVMKEFPILGPDSVTAARMALAAANQGKYEELHYALMASPGKLDEAKAFKIAEQIGLDMDRLRADMRSPEVEDALARNYELAQALKIKGTPAFVIGEELVRGAIDMATMREMVDAVRAKSS